MASRGSETSWRSRARSCAVRLFLLISSSPARHSGQLTHLVTVSQFTLHARLTKGTKPDFHKSMGGAQAKELYDELLAKLRTQYVAERVKDGAFGEMMQCSLTNDGPVTILVDTDIKK